MCEWNKFEIIVILESCKAIQKSYQYTSLCTHGKTEFIGFTVKTFNFISLNLTFFK